jgi:rSAM/selenodomain-associated transferase 1
MDRQLVVMAKAPRLGQVKTRLAREIGDVAALAFFRRTCLDLLRRVSPDPRWQTVLALTPDIAVHEEGIWPEGIPRIAQGQGDLGARMGRLFHDMPPGPVVIIGGDIPGIANEHIARAFDALGKTDTVLGPADDGGYWLVGMKRFPRVAEIFDGVRWSSEYALADTKANIERAGLTLALTDMMNDIDTGADYRRWKEAERRKRK